MLSSNTSIKGESHMDDRGEEPRNSGSIGNRRNDGRGAHESNEHRNKSWPCDEKIDSGVPEEKSRCLRVEPWRHAWHIRGCHSKSTERGSREKARPTKNESLRTREKQGHHGRNE